MPVRIVRRFTLPPLEAVVEECREALRARVITQHPAFAASIILSLAIGISCAAGVFAIVESARFGRLPFTNADRIEHVYRWSRARPEERLWSVPPAVLTSLPGESSPVASFAAYQVTAMRVNHGERTSRPWGARVTTNFTSLLGAHASLGRLFDSTDVGAPAVVLSHDYWRSEFGADSAIIGRVIQVDGATRVVIGVASRPSTFPEQTSLWESGLLPSAAPSEVQLLALLNPGVTRDEARPILASLGTVALRDAAARFTTTQIASTDLRTYMLSGRLKSMIFGLTIIAVFVGLLAAVNVAALMLARGIRRRGEIGVRAALGASVAQLARHVIGECIVLCALGGALGALFAPAVISLLSNVLAADLPPSFPAIEVGWRTVGGGVVLALVVGVVFGLGPALDIARPALGGFLRSASGTTSDGGRLARTRSRLVAIQVALATGVLIALGAVVGRALLPIDADPGFDYAPLIRGFVRDGESKSKGSAFERRLEGVLYGARQTTGIVGAAYREVHYVTPEAIRAAVDDQQGDFGLSRIWIQRVGDGFFGVLQPRLIAGRFATDDELARGAPVAVITHALSVRLFDGMAVGKPLRVDGPGSQRFTVVGVIGDVREHPYQIQTPATVFIPMTSSRLTTAGRAGGRELWIRAMAPGPTALRALRSNLAAAHTMGIEVTDLDALSTMMRRELQSFRDVARVFVAVFVVALLLAAFGIYGLAAYTAEMRSRELAIREALGAARTHIARRVLSGALLQSGVGLVAGAILSTFILEYLNGYQLRLATAFSATAAASVVIGLTVLVASIGPVSAAWRRDLSAVLKVQ